MSRISYKESEQMARAITFTKRYGENKSELHGFLIKFYLDGKGYHMALVEDIDGQVHDAWATSIKFKDKPEE